jgi:hypothetical protein
MPVETPKYDVAISFLVQDISLAAELNAKLAKNLSVFFFPHSQEELAGTDGMVSMREPFYSNSRINVIMYREKWVNTPWTAVEAEAIKGSCLANAYRTLFIFVVEQPKNFPKWIPDTHVRFNYGDFSIDEAVGAIKARVNELSSSYQPPSPARHAEILRTQVDLQFAKSRLRTPEGIKMIFSKVRELFDLIETHCEEINLQRNMEIIHGRHLKEGETIQTCNISDGRVGLSAFWRQRSNALDDALLTIREVSGSLFSAGGVHVESPQALVEEHYLPDVSPAFEYGWRPVDGTEFISCPALAAKCVSQFINLVARYNNGEIERSFFTGQGGWTY